MEVRDSPFSLLPIMMRYVNLTCIQYALFLLQLKGRLVEEGISLNLEELIFKNMLRSL